MLANGDSVREIKSSADGQSNDTEVSPFAEGTKSIFNRTEVKETARRRMNNDALIADTETAGFAKHVEVVEVAIVNCPGSTVFREFIGSTVLLNSAAKRVHGASDEFLGACRRDGKHGELCCSIAGLQLVFSSRPSANGCWFQ